ncbi:VacB/RNase II family 3'-5' exoribonuclease [Gilvimarinus polysaccharolyticus]|uniref:VacB/RNase II family 3'-5' exoribonuclease n=1 Tax=Gilvimarinus polysaccharolyticus TaxID=863921 RepID=UPI000673902C|nr:VacB/RNase II family 3'-5' exoribonuclease [Gilvimarinus polysaccharolyticus]
MLSKDAISQLSQLKSSIVSDKTYAEGTVRPTAKRFGFVRLDDGRDAFLNPDQMLRVLPGDRVKVSLTENSKKQLEATLDTLLETPLTTFVGRYVRKGPAHFVEPDLPPFNRWLFIPPHERTNCTEGDLVACELVRHPFKHEGKAQIRVINRIGRPDEIGIEGRYIAAKFNLPSEWSEAALEQSQNIKIDNLDDTNRIDLTQLPLVTIDSEFTRDMDDAVHAVGTGEGWTLTTAIADPSAFIRYGSALDDTARTRGSTLYLLGHPITMLPTELSHDTFSLMPDEVRPALVCEIQVDSSGNITDYRFQQALIKSHHKLSYQAVSDLLDQTEGSDDSYATLPDTVRESLNALRECAAARLNYRREHALVMEDRADYQYWLNDQKKIERIEMRQRNIAQKIVEEAMLATNICAGNLFKEHPNTGLYSGHVGFRPERLEDAKQLTCEHLPEFSAQDLAQLPHFQALFKHLRDQAPQSPELNVLLSLLQRLQQAGSLSAEHQSHFGLGFDAYATVTSPIRRYQDLFNHYALKAILNNHELAVAPSELAEQQQKILIRGRQASRQLEHWLLCQYLAEQVGTVHFGTITGVSPNGINVRLNDIGCDGFVLLSEKGKPRPKFDSRRLQLTTETTVYTLDETIAVKISAVDVDTRRISLELVNPAIAERLQAFEPAP